MTSEDGIGMYLSVPSVRLTVKDTSGVVRETVEIQVGAVTQIT
jgi:hypothetical protein